MITVEKVGTNGTLELVVPDDSSLERVTRALAGSDWEDTWSEAWTDEPENELPARMQFDKADQATILKLINEQPGDEVQRVRA